MYNLPPDLEPLFVRVQVLLGSRTTAFHWRPLAIGPKPVLTLQVIDYLGGIRHRALLIRDFSADDAAAIVRDDSVIEAAFREVEMRFARHLDEETADESSYNMPFSNRLFIFTDRFHPSRRELLTLLNPPTRRAATGRMQDGALGGPEQRAGL
jgi:hypothetical protein